MKGGRTGDTSVWGMKKGRRQQRAKESGEIRVGIHLEHADGASFLCSSNVLKKAVQRCVHADKKRETLVAFT